MSSSCGTLDQLFGALGKVFSREFIGLRDQLIAEAHAQYLCLRLSDPIDIKAFTARVNMEMEARRRDLVNVIDFVSLNLGIFPYDPASRIIPYKGHLLRAIVYQAGSHLPESGQFISGTVAVAKLRGSGFVEKLLYFDTRFFETQDAAMDHCFEQAMRAIDSGRFTL